MPGDKSTAFFCLNANFLSESKKFEYNQVHVIGFHAVAFTWIVGMGLFTRANKNEGWLAIVFDGAGICAASIKRLPTGKPSVEFSAFYASEQAFSADTLDKLSRQLRTQAFHCTTLLGDSEYQLLAVDAPNVPADELKAAVRWRLKEMLDFPVEEATIDVLDIPVDKNGPGRARSMFVVAARNGVIEQRQKLLSQAKVDLSVIDLPEMAQRNISALLEVEGRGLALLSFNADGGLLTVTYAGELYLSRRIDVTLAQLLDSDEPGKAIYYDKITLELQRSLDHFDRQFHFIAVSRLVLAPAGTDGLHAYLAANLYMPVERLDLADVMDLSKVPDLADVAQQQRFFLPLGAALRSSAGQQINLFNPDLLKKKKVFSALATLRVLGVIVLACGALALFGSQRVAALEAEAAASTARLAEKETRLASVNREFAGRQVDPVIAAEIASRQAELDVLQQAAGVLQRGGFGSTDGYAEYFRAFARASVPGLWLTGVSIGSNGSEIGLQGRALQPELIPNYISRLARDTVLQGKVFGSLEIFQPAAKGPGAAPFLEFALQSRPADVPAGVPK